MKIPTIALDVISRPKKEVPKELATPTDLSPEDTAAIATALNKIISDSFALYIKLKSCHWHVYGPRFHDLHLLFEEQAGTVLGSIDDIAERVRRIGHVTVKSLGQLKELTGIEDDNTEPEDAQDMIRRLLQDYEKVQRGQRDAIQLADSSGDTPTGNLLQGVLDQTEKGIWFFNQILQGK